MCPILSRHVAKFLTKVATSSTFSDIRSGGAFGAVVFWLSNEMVFRRFDLDNGIFFFFKKKSFAHSFCQVDLTRVCSNTRPVPECRKFFPDLPVTLYAQADNELASASSKGARLVEQVPKLTRSRLPTGSPSSSIRSGSQSSCSLSDSDSVPRSG